MSVPIEHTHYPQRNSKHRLRLITATSRFDGHDVSINILRRLLQDAGAEVIHLGFNRSVKDVVTAAIQEDVDAVAMSSYQGGHLAYFRYLREALDQAGASHVLIFAGGGGTITQAEAEAMEHDGVERIYMPEDGQRLGLAGIISDVLGRIEAKYQLREFQSQADVHVPYLLSQNISYLENTGALENIVTDTARGQSHNMRPPVIGISGPGGAGKSTLMNALLERFKFHYPDIKIALIANDPTRQKSGGALLGDRMRITHTDERTYMRSMATREENKSISGHLSSSIEYLKQSGFDLLLVESAGSGQSDASLKQVVDVSLYVMTSEYGAASQLEKVEMLDQADFIVLNKADRSDSEDALAEVRQQWQYNHHDKTLCVEDCPVFATQACRYHDAGTDKLFLELANALVPLGWHHPGSDTQKAKDEHHTVNQAIIPDERKRYLAEIGELARARDEKIEAQLALVESIEHFHASLRALGEHNLPEIFTDYPSLDHEDKLDNTLKQLRNKYRQAIRNLSDETKAAISEWKQIITTQDSLNKNTKETISHITVPDTALPEFQSIAEWIKFLLKENLPGKYPYTAGVFASRRYDEEPMRMFAGLATPEKTNQRFLYLTHGQKSKRLSTAFDPVSLYGEDPDAEADIWGCIGMSGVSVASLDDMKKLYSGINLLDEKTSVSMTINGPAPIFLAWFFNTAIDQQIEIYLKNQGEWEKTTQQIEGMVNGDNRSRYNEQLPAAHDGIGLGLLGVHGSEVVNAETYAQIHDDVMQHIRGTLQADILKEDQAQNECLFPVDFSLQLMADIERYFIEHQVKHYYSVSVSGYHIAEAGANPVTQLAFTLANGFTLLEYYLGQGLDVDHVARHMSFFFSNAMDPEYAVIGRVARRIWAKALKYRYGADANSQKLKYHIQTSGRSLQAKDINFNDARTTLEALYAIMDNCNSLHTNAYDEAVTTPTEESVRRALAIQMIIQREYGLTATINPLQGAYYIERLTDMVEQAVYQEFERISRRGGVLGAMEHLYQRRVIQEESLYFEQQAESGAVKIIGVNDFIGQQMNEAISPPAVVQSSEQDKAQQVESIRQFKERNHSRSITALKQLKAALYHSENSFAALMTSSRYCSLGQLTHAIAEVGGRYIRNM